MGFWASGEDITGAGGMPGQKPTFNVKTGPINKTPGYEQSKSDIMALYDARKRLGGPAAVVAAKAGYTAPSSTGAKYQADSAAMLNAASQGNGPSVAKSVMGQGVDEALRNRQAALAAGKPTPLAQQAAMGAASGAMSQAAASSAAAKAQEVQSATSQYGAALGAMRAADFATAQGANKVGLANAQMEQQANLQNQKAQMDWYAMSDAEKNALLGMAFGLDQNEAVNRQNYWNFVHGGQMQKNAIDMRDRAMRDAQYGQALMGAGQAVGYGAQAYAASKQNTWDDPYGDLKR